MEPSDPIAERAIALVVGGGRDGALGELIRLAGDQPATLVRARDFLVGRLRQDSDDFAATGGLTLLNAAIAELGSQGEYTWKPRRQK